MPRYVVLLRGINLGKVNRLPMADLRALLADLGYTDVRTILNSGNAVVTGPESEPGEQAERLGVAIRERFGMNVRCMVLTADHVRAIVDGHPFSDVADNGSRMMANVLASPLDPARLTEHDPIALDPERARLGDRVIYQWCPDGVIAAPGVGGFVEKHFGVPVTARNWNTITKIADLL